MNSMFYIPTDANNFITFWSRSRDMAAKNNNNDLKLQWKEQEQNQWESSN